MAQEGVKKSNARISYEYRRKKNAEEMRYQVVSFTLMIFLTILAFVAVGSGKFHPDFVVPFILLLAVVQVLFQLFYFMHMSHKGHELPKFFLYGGAFAGFLTVLAMVTIVWW
jgi:cytochrome c oxidase subunit 4